MKLEAFFRRKGNMILLATLCTFLWGCAFPAVKLGYQLFSIPSEDVSSQILFAGLRFFAAGVVTLVLAAASKRRFPGVAVKTIPGVLLLGLVQTALQYFFFYVGLSHTSGTRGSILNATSTFMTVIFVGILWRKKEPITARNLLGCLLGLSGVILINLSGIHSGQPFTPLGDGMVLLSSLCLALCAPLTKVLARGTDSMSLTGWQLTFGGALLLLTGLVSGGRLGNAGAKGVLLLAFMVMISAVAFPIWTCLLKFNPVSQVAVYNFLIPVFGVILSSVLLGEGFPGASCLGALALVCLGIVAVNGEKKPTERA